MVEDTKDKKDKKEATDKVEKILEGEEQINPDLWTEEVEGLLCEWSEKASCYRWLHSRSEKKYKSKYYCFSIPVIILSTLTGAANVGMDSFVPAENKAIASAIVGGVNIFAGIVSTLQNFLKVAELMEAHRIAGCSWSKLGRNISIELALDPRRRTLATDFLKLSRAEYDRLIEQSPMIDDDIINRFKTIFKEYEVSKPSICNGLDKCEIYKKKDTDDQKEGSDKKDKDDDQPPKGKSPKDQPLKETKKEDVTEDVKEDVTEDVKEDVTEDVKEDVKEDVTEDVKEKVNQLLKEEVKHADQITIDIDDDVEEPTFLEPLTK